MSDLENRVQAATLLAETLSVTMPRVVDPDIQKRLLELRLAELMHSLHGLGLDWNWVADKVDSLNLQKANASAADAVTAELDAIVQQAPKRVTLSGKPAELPIHAPAPAPINPDTQQHRDYWVLSEAERSLGFIRPVRLSYVHEICGVETRMAQAIAETYARDPKYYGSTFCISCRAHFPVQQFVWNGTQEKVGS